MKNFVILVILIALAYFGYNAFNKSDTLNQENTYSQIAEQEGLEDIAEDIPTGTQGALIDINNQIQNAIGDAKEVVEKTQDRVSNTIEEGITDLADTDISIKTGDTTSTSPGLFVDYEEVNLAALDGDIVLDFYASWCPSCRKLEKDINNSLLDIPSDLTIVKVNYDKEVSLKNAYGVTRQHTFVQVDNQGNLIQKWSGGNTLESIIAKIK